MHFSKVYHLVTAVTTVCARSDGIPLLRRVQELDYLDKLELTERSVPGDYESLQLTNGYLIRRDDRSLDQLLPRISRLRRRQDLFRILQELHMKKKEEKGKEEEKQKEET